MDWLGIERWRPPPPVSADVGNASFQGQASDHRHENLRHRAAVASLVTAVALVLIKLSAVIATGSVAVLSTLLDSAADVIAAMVTLVGVRHAARPADRAHRFGHGKADALAALAHGVFIAGAGLLIVADAGRRLVVEPHVVAVPRLGLLAMAACFVLTSLLVLHQRHVVRRAGSQAIRADCLNHSGDLLTMAAVFLSLLLGGATGWSWIDPAAALLIALWLLWSAFGVTTLAVNELMDRELPSAYRGTVKALIAAHPEVQDLHDLRTRGAGPSAFIEVHCEFDGALSLNQVHDVMDEIENKLNGAFPGTEIIIHPEPAGIEDRRLDDRLSGA